MNCSQTFMFIQKLKPVESNAPDTSSPQKASREPEPGPSHVHSSEAGAPEAAHVPPGVAAMNAALERQKKESTRKRPLQVVVHSIPDSGEGL